jgi:ubiquinone/menaquinone biosynthesis C-methylase UbiE
MSPGFDRVAGVYDATRVLPQHAAAPIADAIERLSGATIGTRFLEPGIGTGRIALPLIERGHDYTGLDASPKMLEIVRRKAGSHRVTLVQGDVTAMPFDAASFEVVVLAHVLHLVRDWPRALAEARRVLAPGGALMYASERWASDSPRRVISALWRDILAAHGVDVRYPGARMEPVLDALREQGAELETAVAARWRTDTTVAAAVAGYEERAWSATWRVSDDLHATAVEELRGALEDRFGGPDGALHEDVAYVVTVARGWARS